MSNNKQSSVEYYINNLIDILGDEICNKLTIEQTNRIHFLEKQAKAMHKDEVIDAVGIGSQFDRDYLYGYHDKAEQYYNETFGGNK